MKKTTLHVANFKIRHITDGGSLYGVDMTSGEQVFIGSHIINRDYDIGDVVRCACEDNFKSDDTHWYALLVEPVYDCD